MEIDLKQISVVYDRQPVIDSLSLKFTHELTYLTGLNGSGKTTLLHCLSGLIDFKGEVLINNSSLSSISRKKRAALFAFVLQKTSIPYQIKIYDLILSGRFPHLNWLGTYQEEDFNIVDLYLQKLEIGHLKYRRIDQVSGGELQKAFIARALVQDTPIILLDEPAQSLDPKNKAYIYHLLRELADSGKTIICSTHDLDPLIYPEVRVVGLKAGKVVFDERGGELRDRLMNEVY